MIENNTNKNKNDRLLYEYRRWIDQSDKFSSDLREELEMMDDVVFNDAFYRDLMFGTGGLRGVIGAGTNRMNVHVVAKASQGLAKYVLKRSSSPSIAIAYDSRIKSDLFSKTAAEVFAANGIAVYIFPTLMPTPCLSYAVRKIGCDAGIVITASHNPAKYNGYKVYGSDGCQITTEAAADIYSEIEKLDIFDDVKRMGFDEAVRDGKIQYISSELIDSFIADVQSQSVLYGDSVERDLSIVYSPLNGTGLVPVTRVLQESGFTNVTVVEEQREPDGNFPTCPYPNPEVREAMELGIEYARKLDADLLIATDPDCDRCGIAVRDGDDYRLISGNETGLLLIDYICSQRKKHGMMPEYPVLVKTIVTTDLAEKIAAAYGVRTINVLTGFKFIGEVIGRLEDSGRENDYIFGFEESYGYLTGSYVRDKDAVNAAFMICEMFAFYKTRGISLIDKLNDIYKKYGYCLDTLHSYEFEGAEGMQKMESIMKAFRSEAWSPSLLLVDEKIDYLVGVDGLPKSDVIKFIFKGGSSTVIRPSGTEPKLKVYISAVEDSESVAREIEHQLLSELSAVLNCST